MKVKKILTKKLFGTIPVFLLIALIGIGGVSATLLDYYGVIEGTANVEQSVVFSEGDSTTKAFSFDEEDVTVTAGATKIDTFTLKNRADVKAPITFSTTYDPTLTEGGITTKYYKLKGFSGTIEESEAGSDLSTISYDDAYGDVDYSVSYEGKKVVFTVDTPSGMVDTGGHDNIAFEFDNNADGTPDWQVKYQPNAGSFGDYKWGYKEYDGSSWTAFQDASNVVTVERTDGTFKVKVDASKLRGFGSDYKYGFEIWNRNPESTSEDVPQFVKIELPSPDGFSWSDMSGYTSRAVGNKISEGNAITLDGGESFDFAVANHFDVALKGGDYTITSKIVPQ